ncbi:hypothetical protein SDC49_09970 [Lactobacillus sp. R2/2]|nr:hypothetical protein [Lactobacillus sp. R2/2]
MVKTFVMFFLLIPVFSIIITPAAAISLIALLIYARTNPWLSISIIVGLLLVQYLSNSLLIIKQWREAQFDAPISFSILIKIIFLLDIYRWSLAIVPYKALGRLIVGNNSWSKTSHN